MAHTDEAEHLSFDPPAVEARRPNERTLLQNTRQLADLLALRPNLGLTTAPLHELDQCRKIGLLTAPLPIAHGGLGLGSERGTHETLLRILAALGGADLALGRIYEGHVNGLILIQRYGTAAQVDRIAEDIHQGKLSGVWNTGQPALLQLLPTASGYAFAGEKVFATGAAFVQRPVVTAELPGSGWCMTLPRMEASGTSIDRSFWHPLGMESSESFGLDFTGKSLALEDLLGAPGDFYRDPLFRGGAVRFAAVQAGAVIRLHCMFAEWLVDRRRGDDPYQLARLGRIAVAAQEAAMWVEKAAAVSEACFDRTDPLATGHMVSCANRMRCAIERLGTSVMQEVLAGVGAHGLLQPARFERVIRDLTMYLRQPAPDATLADIGRSSLEMLQSSSVNISDALWSEPMPELSLPAEYFDEIYERSNDPWDFETSDYERLKYQATLDALPSLHYNSALEIGCSIGVLTHRLADRCSHLLSVDVSEKALQAARDRCSNQPHVHFERLRIPSQSPDGSFDLILLSEVGYYWSLEDSAKTAALLAPMHVAGGHLVLVHLHEQVPDYPRTGDEVHGFWLSRPEWKHVHGERHARYRIDVLERVSSATA